MIFTTPSTSSTRQGGLEQCLMFGFVYLCPHTHGICGLDFLEYVGLRV